MNPTDEEQASTGRTPDRCEICASEDLEIEEHHYLSALCKNCFFVGQRSAPENAGGLVSERDLDAGRSIFNPELQATFYLRMAERAVAQREAALDFAAKYSEGYRQGTIDERREAIIEEVLSKARTSTGTEGGKEK